MVSGARRAMADMQHDRDSGSAENHKMAMREDGADELIPRPHSSLVARPRIFDPDGQAIGIGQFALQGRNDHHVRSCESC